MSEHRGQVAAALDALRVESATSFSWYAEPSPPLPAEVAGAMTAETARAYLRHALQQHLYANFYCPGRAMPRQPSRMARQPHGASLFIDGLSRANSGSGSRESGWTIVRAEPDGRLVVRRHGLTLWARPDEVAGAGTAPGSEVSVRLPPELLRLSPGFYMALGDEELREREPIVRHYWHLSSDGGAALVAAATRTLNAERLPFRLKVLNDPADYLRCDAGVLYTARSDQGRLAALVAQVHAEVAGHLRPTTPALTKHLAHGLGLAEGPPGGDSFGMHRCGLLADALLRAFELGLTTTPERLALVERHLGEQGVTLDRPYLEAGSSDDYEQLAA